MKSLSEEDFYDMANEDSENEIKEIGGLKGVKRRQLKQAMKESLEMTWRSGESHTRDIGGSSSQPSESGINRELRRSFTTREVEILARGIDPYMFPTKQKSIKGLFVSSQNVASRKS